MKLTMGQAAKQASVSKTTLSRAVNSGKLSAEKQSNGSYLIDPSELFRVFPRNRTITPPLQPSGTPNGTAEQASVTPSVSLELVRLETENAALKREIALLTEQVADLKIDRDGWKQQAAVVKVIADMRPKSGLIWSLFRRS